MKTRRFVFAARSAAFVALVAGAGSMLAQGGTALSGVVTSQAEGRMEGVIVTARRNGANFDVSVVSDAKGNYSFPRSTDVGGMGDEPADERRGQEQGLRQGLD